MIKSTNTSNTYLNKHKNLVFIKMLNFYYFSVVFSMTKNNNNQLYNSTIS